MDRGTPSGNGTVGGGVVVREVERVVEKPEPTTIMGERPLVDDRVRQLIGFILEHVNSANVEVEAKLGVLMEKEKGLRVIEVVPVLCETPIKSESNSDVRFVSDVGQALFCRLNERLNERVEKTSQLSEGSIRYVRTNELDVYYPGRIRAIKALRDGSYHFVKAQRKTRLGDLNVICPGRICDIRYSASAEEDCIAPDANPELEREKERISYKFDCLSVDITSVNMAMRNGEAERTFEVEVEIDASANLFDEVTKYREEDNSSKLFEIAESFVNTVRLLLEI